MTPLPPGVLFDKDGTLFGYRDTWVPINHAAAHAVSEGNPLITKALLAAGGYDSTTDTLVPDGLLAAGNTREIAECWHEVLSRKRVASTGGHSSARADEPRPRARQGVEAIAELIETVYRREGPIRAVPVTNLRSLLGALVACGHRLGLATSDSESAAEDTLERFGVRELFAFVAGYDSGYDPKPQAAMVYGFCRAVGTNPGEVAVVGDTPHDMRMGRAAGAGEVIGVLTGASSNEDLLPLADSVLPDIEALRLRLRDPDAGGGRGILSACTKPD